MESKPTGSKRKLAVRRQAVKVACDVCARGKRKCSGDVPCERCKRLKIACHYSKPTLDMGGGGSAGASDGAGFVPQPRMELPIVSVPAGGLTGRPHHSFTSLPQQVGHTRAHK